MPQITAAQIRHMSLSRSVPARIADGIVANQKFIEQGGIDTPLRLCHFMAQCAVESAHFTVTLEFASGRAYEGREDLGNTEPGDGPRYRGRGVIQTTGRANYREATRDIRAIDSTAPDFEANPEQLQEFPWALLAAVTYWRRRNLNRFADRDDVRAVTRGVNGGLNGLAQRTQYLARAKSIWLDGEEADAEPDQENLILRNGATGHDVVVLQNALIDAGFRVSVDGVFGQNTGNAVRAFQEANGLDADGIVGPRTWAVLLNG